MSHKVEIHLMPVSKQGSYVRIDGRDISVREVKVSGGVDQTTNVHLTLPACEVLITSDGADISASRLIDTSAIGDKFRTSKRANQ